MTRRAQPIKRTLTKRSLFAALAVVATLGATPSASAQSKKSRADELFEQGKSLLQAGDWPGACAKFQASFEADPAVSTVVKLARCREHEGKLAQALAEYRRALELNQTLVQSKARARELESLIRTDLSALEPRVPKLQLELTPRPAGLEVLVNGTPVPEASLAAPFAVDPGELDVVVRAPGYREERQQLHLPEGVTQKLVLGLVAEVRPAVAPVANAPSAVVPVVVPPANRGGRPEPTDAPEPARSSAQRTIGLVVGGAGVAVLGVAAYFGVKTIVLVNQASPHCPDSECDPEGYRMIDEAGNAQTTGFILAGVGVALFGAGVAIYFTAPSDGARSNQKALAARFGPSGAKLEGTF